MMTLLPRMGLMASAVWLLLCATAEDASAKIRWEPAFPRPHGIILTDEINQETMAFYIDNKDKTLRIGGRFHKYNFGEDLSYAVVYAKEMFNVGLLNRDTLYRCRTNTSKEDLKKISRIARDSQLIFEGKLVDYDGRTFLLEDCTVRTDVNLFHPGDISIIEGTWCHTYNGTTYSTTTYSRAENGLYREVTRYDQGYVREDLVKITNRHGELKITVVTEGYRPHSRYRTLAGPMKLSEEYATLSKPRYNDHRCKVISY
ncbi:MAG: hypothetical protein EP335_05750 [Alphaproteobacteria bacterium]|nr:MAG: hypothetical protein EP335_05750 [Alphaproteobacteria bacterium]